MDRKIVIKLGILFFLIIASLAINAIILGGAKAVKLDSAPTLSGMISQSIQHGQDTKLPQAGEDYSIKNIKYFDNGTWVVVSIIPTHAQFNRGLVVLEKINGVYEVVMGPGTAFDKSYLLSLPTDVGNNLKSRGAIYESR